MAVDGGNRKWFGTDRGLWLFSENGDELISRYTRGNSPLPSDTINSITIDNNTGEVFIGTTRGIASFRTDASASVSAFRNVKVFPNPVTPDYQGLIGISGLATDANVKITDVSGRLVREISANGGTASWDGLDLNGFRAQTGVYLIFSSDEEGLESFAGKLAIVR